MKQVDKYLPEYKDVEDFKDVGFLRSLEQNEHLRYKDVKDFKDAGLSQLKQVYMYFPEYKDIEDFKDVGFSQKFGVE